MISVQLVVVGGGPGGYRRVSRSRSRHERRSWIGANPGGVCVYRGCIPSKALLHVAKLVDESRYAKAWGIDFGPPRIDLEAARLQNSRQAPDQRLWAARDARCGTTDLAESSTRTCASR
jgi:pyruvate/2-oxoglutarate dehydrogenase complex dihydrolipoamide dehydrogenase (E3) component